MRAPRLPGEAEEDGWMYRAGSRRRPMSGDASASAGARVGLQRALQEGEMQGQTGCVRGAVSGVVRGVASAMADHAVPIGACAVACWWLRWRDLRTPRNPAKTRMTNGANCNTNSKGSM